MSQPTETIGCSEVLERLEEHLDGELSRDESAAVTEHLTGCAGCAREARLAEAVRSELQAMPSYDAPASVLAVVRWSTGRVRAPGRLARMRPLLAVAAAVLIAVVIGLVSWDRPESRPSADDPEIARATAEARYALALVGAVSRRAALNDLLGEHVLSPTVRSVAKSLRGRVSPSLGDRPQVATEDANSEGSQG